MKKIVLEIIQCILVYVFCTIYGYYNGSGELSWLITAMFFMVIYPLLKLSDKKRKDIISIIVPGIIAVVVILISLVIFPMFDNSDIEMGEEEFEATVSSVSRVGQDYLIETNEYSCKLLVDDYVLVDKRAGINLSTGEKIFFKLIKMENNPLNDPQIEQVSVVSLRTQTDDIVTIDSYNTKQKGPFQATRMFVLILGIILGIVAVVNLIVVVKNKKSTNK